MYRRVFCQLIFAAIVQAAAAQVSVSLQEPPAGIVQRNQLWNLALIYSGSGSLNVTVGLTLTNMTDNQPVMTAFTKPVTLTKGVKQIKLADISPVDYTFLSPAFNRLTDALLPIGNYRACYSIYNGTDKGDNILAEDCMNIEVIPLSPPQLAMPADAASIQTHYPQFSWLPPAPLTLFNDLNYDLLLTEVRPDQTAAAAIQENLPVYNMGRLTAMISSYPASAKSLDTGKLYAWRVVAKNGEAFAAQSEVWTFRVQPEKPESLLPAGGVYLELKNDNGYKSTAVLPDNILGIKYYSYDKTHETAVRFLDARGALVKEVKKPIEYGNNFLVFKLDHSFSKETTYFIEIADVQDSRYRASFIIAK